MLIENGAMAALFVIVVSGAIFGYATFIRRGETQWVSGLGVTLMLSLFVGLIPGGYSRWPQTFIVVMGWAALVRRWPLLGIGPAIAPNTGSIGARVNTIFVRRWSREQKWDRFWFVLPLLYFFVRLLSAGVAQQHSDPMYYHLAAPKLWAALGQIRLTPEHPSYAQAGIWENIYGFPQFWLGTQGFSAHMTTQIFGQWMHALWGQLGCVFIAAAILKRLMPVLRSRPGQRFFIAWLCVCPASLEWLGCLAKNDYILTLFALAAVIEAVEGRSWRAGLMAGLSYAAKTLGIMLVVSLPVFILLKYVQDAAADEDHRSRFARAGWPSTLARLRSSWKPLGAFGIGAALTIAPFLLRNMISTGNPMFPYLDEVIGPHWISNWWVGHLHASGGDLKVHSAILNWMWNSLFLKPLPKILLVGGLVFYLAEWRHKGRSHHLPWVGFLAVQTVVMLVLLRPASDGRYGIFTGILWLLFSGSILFRGILRLPLFKVFRGIASVLLFSLGLLINTPLDWVGKFFKHYAFASREKYVEQFHWTYDSKRWLNENTAPGSVILFTSDKMNFFLDRPFETMPEMKKWEDRMESYKTPHELFAGLRGFGYRYLHVNTESCYPGALKPYWNQLLAYKDRAAYSSSTSLVFDLNNQRL